MKRAVGAVALMAVAFGLISAGPAMAKSPPKGTYCDAS